MSIATAIAAAQSKVANAYTAVSTKGGTLPATQDLSNLPTAISSIPTGGGPAYYVEKTVDANGKLVNSTNIINLNGVTDVGNYVLYAAYYAVAFPANTSVDFSSLTTISGSSACYSMFQICTGLTSVDLSALTTISGGGACYSMFQTCTGLTSVDLSSLTTISGSNACYYMFSGCSGLTSVDLSSLTTISGSNACQAMFNGCLGLTSINLSSLTTISGATACWNMFYRCTGLTSVDLSNLTTINVAGGCQDMFRECSGLTSADLSSLTTISERYACQEMFMGCTSLATVYIGGTTAIDFGTYTNQFQNMFKNCSQNIDVYAPAANQATIEAMSGYPNFGGTGTVTWHWRS